MAAAGVTDVEAGKLLAAADGEVKAAILMGRLGVSATQARRRLERARGHVRKALQG
jgi:N-acetylmuramic acid 6-phosphate (MurNAc-6-P) etherase